MFLIRYNTNFICFFTYCFIRSFRYDPFTLIGFIKEYAIGLPGKIMGLFRSSDPKQQIFANEAILIIISGMTNTDRAFALAKKWGTTHVHSYGMGKYREKGQNFFVRAADYKLKVMTNLRGRYWVKRNNGIDSMRSFARHFKDYPALGFWYLFDEPDNKGFQSIELRPFYKMIYEETWISQSQFRWKYASMMPTNLYGQNDNPDLRTNIYI